MTHFSRYTAIIAAVLLALIVGATPVANAKHIIVIYDVSGSMYRLKTSKDTYITYMESEDIRRVNDYVTELLFTNAAQPLRDIDDTYIKEYDADYLTNVSKPLYQNGDVLTYAEYAKQRHEKISRKPVSRTEFQSQLPDATRMKAAFYGKVSYLLRAETEVYDELYRETDDGTYWIFVTDGDIDNSGKSDTGIAAILKRLAEIEEEYYAPLVLGVLVNNHVKIEVRKLHKRRDIDTIFIANQMKRDAPTTKVSLSNDDAGQFISETLVIDTKNSQKAKFQLDSVTVEVVDKNGKPLQVAHEDAALEPLLLRGNPPPYELRIPFPDTPELATPGNRLKLEVTYTYDGVDKVHPAPLMNYTAVIDSVYITELANPYQPAKQLGLVFADDTYRGELVVRSESRNKSAFHINRVRCHVQYKDGRKLCAADVSNPPGSLDVPFSVVVPKENDLDWYGNKLALDIEYTYDGNPRFATIGVPFKLQGGGGGFPMWLLVILLLPLVVALFFLARWLLGIVGPYPIQIRLVEVGKTGELVPGGKEESIGLPAKATLNFGPGGLGERSFDIGCPAFLYHKGKFLQQGEILLFEDDKDSQGRALGSQETLTLRRNLQTEIVQALSDDEEVYVHFEIVPEPSSETQESSPDSYPIIEEQEEDTDPLDR